MESTKEGFLEILSNYQGILHKVSLIYFENKSFTEVLKTEESVIGLIVGTPIGLFASYYAARKIWKYQLQNLEFLKDLYGRLCNMS